jgi:hypothetical protein
MFDRYPISAGTGRGVGAGVFSGTVVVTVVCAVVTFVSGVYSSTHPAVIRTASTIRREKYRLIIFFNLTRLKKNLRIESDPAIFHLFIVHGTERDTRLQVSEKG